MIKGSILKRPYPAALLVGSDLVGSDALLVDVDTVSEDDSSDFFVSVLFSVVFDSVPSGFASVDWFWLGLAPL